MPQLHITPAATADLESIWSFTFDRWGETQADLYFDHLIARMEQLPATPLLGQPRDEIRQGYRSLQVKQHVVYYRLIDEKIEVVRVLHERMVPANHL